MIIVAPGVVVAPSPGGEPELPPIEYVPYVNEIRPRLAVTWTSWTGESWAITDPASQVFVLQGATGLFGAPVEHWWKDAPSVAGSSHGGFRDARGSVFLPIRIDGASLDSFLAADQAFRRSLDPAQEGTLRVTRPDGQWREIRCRYESGLPEFQIDLDPVMMRRATYGVTWSTADPYWSGQSISQNYANAPAQPWLVPPGPPMYINPSATLATATFTNPGDVDSYPIWRVNGPFTSFTVGLGDSVVTFGAARTASGYVEIDTNPDRQTILDANGIDRWTDATEAEFPPIPPGQNVPLRVDVPGSGPETSVDLTFTPKYRSAW